MDPLSSNSMKMMEKSMEFLWAKQTALLDNIANAETPYYKVKTVTFEETFDRQLREASKKGSGAVRAMRDVIEKSSWTVDEDDEITRMDENGVNVTEQMLESVRTAYQLQYLYRTVSSELTTLNTALTG